MDIFEIMGRVVAYGGGTAAIAWCFFAFLGKKWIENKFSEKLEEYKAAQAKELEHARYEINSLLNRVTKIHEKEFEVLPVAWSNLIEVKNYIAFIVSPLQSYPDFSKYTDEEARDYLQQYKLEESEIEKLICPDRIKMNKDYQDRIFWYHCSEARTIFKTFHLHIVANRIFLSADLKQAFKEADDLLYEALTLREVGQDAKDSSMNFNAYKKLKADIDRILDTIEDLVQKRLHYDDAI